MNGIPTNEEEFRIWMVEKVGAIQTSCAAIEGEVRTANANHEALVLRVEAIEEANKVQDARQWWHTMAILILTSLKNIIFHGKI